MEKQIITMHQFILIDRPYFYTETSLLKESIAKFNTLLYEDTGLGIIEDAILKLEWLIDINLINKELIQRN